MEKNIGYNNRMVRVVIAIAIGVICITQSLSGPLAVYLLSFAELLLLTSSLSFCPVYKVAKIIKYRD